MSEPPSVSGRGGSAEIGTGSDRVLRIEVSARTLLYVAGVLAVVYLVVRLWPIVVMLSFALIFTAALLPLMGKLLAMGLSRPLAMLITVITPLAAISATLPFVVPPLVEEFADIDRNLPVYAARIDHSLAQWGLGTNLEAAVRELDVRRYTGPSTLMQQPVIFGALGSLTVIVLTGYLLVDLPRLERFVYQFVPRGREAEIQELGRSLRRVVGGYVRGQAITSLAITVFTLVVLIAVGAPNPLAFAVVAGLADIIPLVGGFIAVIPAVLATLDVSVERALIVLVCLVAYQQFEDRVLLPRVYAATLHLPTLVVFIVVLAGAQLLGVVGVLLSLPAVAAGRVLIEYALRHKQLVPIMSAPPDDIYAPDRVEDS